MRLQLVLSGLLGALLSFHDVAAIPQSPPHHQLNRRDVITKQNIIYKTEKVTDVETITTTRAAVTTTVRGTSTIITTRKVAPSNAVPSKGDQDPVVVTVTSTTTTTLAPKTVTSARNRKRDVIITAPPDPIITAWAQFKEKRQIRSLLDDLFGGKEEGDEKTTTRTVTKTSTIQTTLGRKITRIEDGPKITAYSKLVTVTISQTTGPAPAPTEDATTSTTTVWETETATPAPVVVPGEEKPAEKTDTGMTAGQKAGLGSAVGIIGAAAIGFAAFIALRKRRRNMANNEKVDFNRLGPDDAYDPSMRGSPDTNLDSLPAHPPPPGGSSLGGMGGAEAMAGIAAGAGLAGAAARSRQQPSSPVSESPYGPISQHNQYSSNVNPDFGPGAYAAGAAVGAGAAFPHHQQQQYYQDDRSASPPDQYHIQPPPPVASPLAEPGEYPPSLGRPIPPFAAAMGPRRLSIHPDVLTPGIPTPDQRRISSFQPVGSAPNSTRNSRAFTAPDLGAQVLAPDTSGVVDGVSSPLQQSSPVLQHPRQNKYSGQWGTKYTPVARKPLPTVTSAAPDQSAPTSPILEGEVAPTTSDTDPSAPIPPPPPSETPERLQPPQRAYAPYRPDSIVVTPATPVLAQNPALKRNSAWEKAAEY
ncbi:hypothetical protein EX30DRAFT_161872 [Ascodesmis nigricans]|uniref:Mid2 domain-containing protein n=1 Tax=Ascodesmis nigricans TaxID=341454 RepID=A0A4S2MMD8_9PEZI|nr:hypothetical protein EX30DRAFT_161872 [Ascodesmis nigricans]